MASLVMKQFTVKVVVQHGSIGNVLDSKSAYAMAGESESPFYCVYCMQSMYKKEIIELREQIHTLTDF